MPGRSRFRPTINGSRQRPRPCRHRSAMAASRATWCDRQMKRNYPRSSSSTKIAASTRISKMWRGGWRLPISSPSRQMRSPPWAAIPGTTRRVWRCSKLDRGKMTEDFLAAARWLKSRPDTTGKLGAVGFCFGGGVVNQLAVLMGPDLAAGVPFYGAQPSAADAAKIKAPINAQYGEQDTRITDGWPAFDAALTEAKVPHEGHVYKGANHGFHNDTTPRYDEAAAKEAWQRTVDWFNKYLRT